MKFTSRFLISWWLGVFLAISLAKASAPPAANPPASGPVDIQANEQEFTGDQILATGNVRVTYKDTVIHAPQAVLTRAANGTPQQAVFTGFPHLLQGSNIINAEKLSFDIANQKILAEGKAHSEIISSDSTPPSKPPAAVNSIQATQPPLAEKVEKVFTDADRQEYDSNTLEFAAYGHVHLLHGDITVYSHQLKLLYGPSKKPETAVFTGKVLAIQGKNNTHADVITYSLVTRRLQASGHVRSKIIQEKKSEATESDTPVAMVNQSGAAMASTQTNDDQSDEILYMYSDSQDFSKLNGRMTADGNVRLVYGETTGAGPQAVLIRSEGNKPEKVIFIGRSQVIQPGKHWVADRVTLIMESKRVLAFGNSKAIILHGGEPSISTFAGNNHQQLASKNKADNSKDSRQLVSKETPGLQRNVLR